MFPFYDVIMLYRGALLYIVNCNHTGTSITSELLIVIVNLRFKFTLPEYFQNNKPGSLI